MVNARLLLMADNYVFLVVSTELSMELVSPTSDGSHHKPQTITGQTAAYTVQALLCCCRPKEAQHIISQRILRIYKTIK